MFISVYLLSLSILQLDSNLQSLLLITLHLHLRKPTYIRCTLATELHRIVTNTPEEDQKEFEQRNWTIREKLYIYKQFLIHYNAARNMLGIYIYSLLLYYKNNRYTNLYHKINMVIDKKVRKKIIIDFSVKESIYINKTHPKYNKEIIYFNKTC